ncbi:pleckstrin homology domain-containing family O member 2 isoform X2 [Hyperolius riggenbachi]|uniref:pleckstrin homology domain-containing family O member 2 isoform X2 n=1 Tax=Hyperolius riggenbachi TaxID=752182 RepID=UPI0035A30AB7
MENGEKGSSVSPPEAIVIHKAGWLKRSSGLLGLWKDRYIQIQKTQLLICDNEDKKCLETLELGSFEKCQDQKALLKRKRHFTLIPLPGTKVQDVKFQARNIEERDAWIQALNEGINRGKNKVLDEVQIDTSCSLEHVTRDRVKVAAAKRRPPTRIHLKEVADAAADDSLRLGLESLDTGILTVVSPMPKPKAAEPEPQKEPVKIPMPPIKPNNPQTLETPIPDTKDGEAQVPEAPSPPSKSLKESLYAREKLLSESEQTNTDEKSVLKAIKSESKENLSDVVNSPPKPPPKILSDKMKIKWVGSASDLDEKENITSHERGSKENLIHFESDELEAPSSSPLGVLSGDLRTKETNNSLSSLQDGSRRSSENLNEKASSKEDLQERSESVCKNIEDEAHHELDDSLTNSVQDELPEKTVIPTSHEKVAPCVKYKKKNVHIKKQMHQTDMKAKSSSMGDLLSPTSLVNENARDKDGAISHLTQEDHLERVEMKLAHGKEKTKALLNQVLMGQFGKTAEDNGIDSNAEQILNELMTQLQEASDVLQVIKEPRSGTSTPEAKTEKQKQKELLAMQRRSVPF